MALYWPYDITNIIELRGNLATLVPDLTAKSYIGSAKSGSFRTKIKEAPGGLLEKRTENLL